MPRLKKKSPKKLASRGGQKITVRPALGDVPLKTPALSLEKKGGMDRAESTGIEPESNSSCSTIEAAEAAHAVAESAHDAIMRIAAALIQMRAGTKSIGTPTLVVELDATIQFRFGNAGSAAASAFKIEFRCDGPRTCPISKEEYTTDFHAVMRAHELTGLMSLYVHCPPCAAKERSAGAYAFVGVLTESEARYLDQRGAFEKARARIENLNAEMAKVTWWCAHCAQSFAERDRPSFECCEMHMRNDEWVCDACRSWNPCEQTEVCLE